MVFRHGLLQFFFTDILQSHVSHRLIPAQNTGGEQDIVRGAHSFEEGELENSSATCIFHQHSFCTVGYVEDPMVSNNTNKQLDKPTASSTVQNHRAQHL